ncbi:protein of unknown function [Ruminococcaceae bacterium BL-6]|nr:protein of unknown function [Ruminococcaceae bacterium BL-6]
MMERITQRIGNMVDFADGKSYAKMSHEDGIRLLFSHLAAYEDTRCAPEEILELIKEDTQLRAVIQQMDPDFFIRKCRVCGCDWNHPCNDHDFWIEDDLCSACFTKQQMKKPPK